MAIDIDQEYAVVAIDDVKEHPQNPKVGHEEAIDESIEENGWYGACVVQKSTGYILAGNHRHRVAKKRGASEIPVIYRDVDDETALRILIGDNRTAELGYMDEELLTVVLASLESLDGTGYGFDAAREKLENGDGSPPPAGGALPGPGGGAQETPTGHVDPETGEIVVPDDKYTPEYGVMVVCKSEAAQKAIYEFMLGLVEDEEELFDGTSLRVIAV